MMEESKKDNSFITALPQNIFSGFIVSLIALPLGLGLAMASGAPPIAGIITAICGGIIVAVLGGSHVTITGPGNSLVGVMLAAIPVLGLNGTYAAIIVSGILMIMLGFARLGKLSNFFPSSAIQGMLAAIGLIILGKQFHIMLGNKLDLPNNVAYLIEIPATIWHFFQFENASLTAAAISGIIALAIMVFYGKIRNKYFRLFPAPMWIVMLSIGLSYFYELVLKQPNPIAADYMIPSIPQLGDIMADLPTPDFSQVLSMAFITNVIALTLIASIESLLSIKAVDKLDPDKRRSNVNRDLKALGLATIGSGFLGGMNVVTVIARSSVNVQNGGSNKSANFFHAIFLLIFIGLFSTQLTRIPLPALMAILVFTGYRLASPVLIKKIARVGKEQLLIFLVTLIVTLTVNLISGILAGVVITLIIHFIINKSVLLFLQNFLKPNVLMYRERSGNYYVSIKHFSSFLNYYKLNDKLDQIPQAQDVVVDFSLCHFVDHTVMENMSEYIDLFHKNGGHFELIGLDLHNADTDHPSALRRLIPGLSFLESNLSKRQTSLNEIASQYELQYESSKSATPQFLEHFVFFKTKQIVSVYNRIFNNENKTFKVFDLNYSEGEFIAKENVKTTMLHIKLDRSVPEFTLDREGFLERVYSIAGFKDIKIKGNKDFSDRFYLLGEDKKAVRAFFNDKVVRFFESNPYYHVESNGKALLVFHRERVAGVKEIKALIDYGKRLKEVLV